MRRTNKLCLKLIKKQNSAEGVFMEDKKGWKEIPIGGVIEKSGNALNYKTGGWRTFRPVINSDKCIGCMLCYLYCPDSSILLKKDDKFKFKAYEVDLDHCKGCGICASVCPVKAIEMKRETEFKDDKSSGHN